MRRISRLLQRTTKSYFFAQETTDGELLGESRHWMQPLDEVSSWSERLTVSFVSAVEDLYLQKKLHSIKQRPEENTTAYILRFLSEAKLAYPTAWAILVLPDHSWLKNKYLMCLKLGCLSLLWPSDLVCKLGGTPLPVISETEDKLMDADALPVLVTKAFPHELPRKWEA